MNWVSGFLGRRSSTPQSLHCGFSESNQPTRDEVTSRNNRRIIGQHSLDQSSFDRFNEYKKDPKRKWKLQSDFIFPDMIGTSEILSKDEIIFLDEEKPERLVGCTWELVFSTEVHGYLLSTLYRNLKSWTGPTLLVVKDKKGHKFGAFVTESFKPDDKIHGGGECFVFRLKHDNLEQLFSYEGDSSSKMFDEQQVYQIPDEVKKTDESIYSASSTSTMTNELIVNEDHFASTPPTYSSSLRKPCDIKDDAKLLENKESTIEENKSNFLEKHDLSEHYVWVWAGENSCFIHGDDQSLHIGLDDGKVALQIDSMLEKGRSQSTRVFDNSPLAPSLSNKDGDFEIVALEIWLFKQL